MKENANKKPLWALTLLSVIALLLSKKVAYGMNPLTAPESTPEVRQLVQPETHNPSEAEARPVPGPYLSLTEWGNLSRQEQNVWFKSVSPSEANMLIQRLWERKTVHESRLCAAMIASFLLVKPPFMRREWLAGNPVLSKSLPLFPDLLEEVLFGMDERGKKDILDLFGKTTAELPQPLPASTAGPSEALPAVITHPNSDITVTQWRAMTRIQQINWILNSTDSEITAIIQKLSPGTYYVAAAYTSVALKIPPNIREQWLIKHGLVKLLSPFPNLLEEAFTGITADKKRSILNHSADLFVGPSQPVGQPPEPAAPTTVYQAAGPSQSNPQLLPGLPVNSAAAGITVDQWGTMNRQEQSHWFRSASVSQRMELHKKLDPYSREETEYWISFILMYPLADRYRKLKDLMGMPWFIKIISKFPNLFEETLTGMTADQRKDIEDSILKNITQPVEPAAPPSVHQAAGASQSSPQLLPGLPVNSATAEITIDQWRAMNRQEQNHWVRSVSRSQREEMWKKFDRNSLEEAEFHASVILMHPPANRCSLLKRDIKGLLGIKNIYNKFPDLFEEILTGMTTDQKKDIADFLLAQNITQPVEPAAPPSVHQAAGPSQSNPQLLPGLPVNNATADITGDQWRAMNRQEQSHWFRSASVSQKAQLLKKFDANSREEAEYWISLILMYPLADRYRELKDLMGRPWLINLISKFPALFEETLTGMTADQRKDIEDSILKNITQPVEPAAPTAAHQAAGPSQSNPQLLPGLPVASATADITVDQWRTMNRQEQNNWVRLSSVSQKNELWNKLDLNLREGAKYLVSTSLIYSPADRYSWIKSDIRGPLFIKTIYKFPDLIEETLTGMTADQRKDIADWLAKDTTQPIGSEATTTLQMLEPRHEQVENLPQDIQNLILPLPQAAPVKEKLSVHWLNSSTKAQAGNLHLTKENKAFGAINPDRAGSSAKKALSYDKIAFKLLSDRKSSDPSELTCEEIAGSVVTGILCKAQDLTHARSAQISMGFDASQFHFPPQTANYPTIGILADKTFQGKSLPFIKEKLEAYGTKNCSFFIPVSLNSLALGDSANPLQTNEPIEQINQSPDISVLRMAALDLANILQLHDVLFIDASVDGVFVNPKSFSQPIGLNPSESQAFYWAGLLDSLKALKDDYQIGLIGIEDLLT